MKNFGFIKYIKIMGVMQNKPKDSSKPAISKTTVIVINKKASFFTM
jgi:hypothetical protein